MSAGQAPIRVRFVLPYDEHVVSKSIRTKTHVALFKNGLMFLGASVVIVQVIWKLIDPVLPSNEVMSAFSLAGLTANGLFLWLLWRHPAEDINMSLVFECFRNDIASNV